MIYEPSMAIVVNTLVFLSLALSSYIIFYFAQRLSSKKQVGISTFILAFGLNLIGLSHLFRLGGDTLQLFVIFSALVGALVTLVGLTATFYGNSIDIVKMKKRHEEIKEVIANLKDRYYKQEITEEDLRDVNKHLIEELAEIEVKLKDSEIHESPEKKTKKSKK